MIKAVLPFVVFAFGIIHCSSDGSQVGDSRSDDSILSKNWHWKDSVLANIPNRTAYYCDTTARGDIGTLPCVEVLTRTLNRINNEYYVLTEQSISSPDKITCDTFFITSNNSWYQLHNHSSYLFFSRDAFRSKTTTSLRRNGFNPTSVEDWIPDTQYVSQHYGELFIFDIEFPLSREPNNVKVHFSPNYGAVHIVSEMSVFSINRIDSIR